MIIRHTPNTVAEGTVREAKSDLGSVKVVGTNGRLRQRSKADALRDPAVALAMDEHRVHSPATPIRHARLRRTLARRLL
jgi:hypothetical protein